jgi:hypothetical protein
MPTACWECTGADGFNGTRSSRPVAPGCAGLRDVQGDPYQGWAPPHEPPLSSVCALPLTDHGRHVTLPADLCAAEPEPGHSRTALWEGSSACQRGDSPGAHRAAPGLSRPRPPARADRGGVGRAARKAHDRSAHARPPVGQAGPARPRQRPQAPEAHAADDRGQRQRHPRQTLLVLKECGHMCRVSPTWAGQASDLSGAERAGYPLPRGRWWSQEKGVQGFFWPGVTIVQPKKNPRGGDRTPPVQAANRQSSSIRMRIEHAMGGCNAPGS